MTTVLVGAVVVLLANIAGGVLRLVFGSDALDRVSACQLIGTLTVSTLLLLAEMNGEPTLRLVALLVALLGAMTVVALLRSGFRGAGRDLQ